MTVEMKLPELGENIESGEVINVLVATGDTIAQDQTILELETDKAVLEVPASVSGVVQDVLVKAGDQISPGQVVLTVGDGDGAPAETDALGATAAATTAAAAETDESESTTATPAARAAADEEVTAAEEPAAETMEVDFKIPELGENIETGTVVNILVAVGDTIEKDQGVLELETDKAVLEVPVDVAGEVTEILVATGDDISTGQSVLRVRTSSAPAKEAPQKAPAPAPAAEEPPVKQKQEPVAEVEQEAAPSDAADSGQRQREPLDMGAPLGERLYDIAPASPSVRRFAREIGLDINYVPGSGPGGRITIDDVKKLVRRHAHEMAQPIPPAEKRKAEPQLAGIPAQKPLPDFSKWGEVEREAMSNIRRATAENLGYSWATIPHVTQHHQADITELENMRKRYARQVEQAGGKLTITAILLKMMAAAMKVFPKFNASIDIEKREIIYKKYVNIGVAVDTPRGLLVPVIRNVDQKNLIQLSLELGEIAEKARNRKTTLDDLQGANMSLTNLGGIGGGHFTPIINPPEVAILGVARGSRAPVWNGSEFEPRMMLPLSLSYDHRLIDGADGARFLVWLVEALENPFFLMVEG